MDQDQPQPHYACVGWDGGRPPSPYFHPRGEQPDPDLLQSPLMTAALRRLYRAEVLPLLPLLDARDALLEREALALDAAALAVPRQVEQVAACRRVLANRRASEPPVPYSLIADAERKLEEVELALVDRREELGAARAAMAARYEAVLLLSSSSSSSSSSSDEAAASTSSLPGLAEGARLPLLLPTWLSPAAAMAATAVAATAADVAAAADQPAPPLQEEGERQQQQQPRKRKWAEVEGEEEGNEEGMAVEQEEQEQDQQQADDSAATATADPNPTPQPPPQEQQQQQQQQQQQAQQGEQPLLLRRLLASTDATSHLLAYLPPDEAMPGLGATSRACRAWVQASLPALWLRHIGTHSAAAGGSSGDSSSSSSSSSEAPATAAAGGGGATAAAAAAAGGGEAAGGTGGFGGCGSGGMRLAAFANLRHLRIDRLAADDPACLTGLASLAPRLESLVIHIPGSGVGQALAACRFPRLRHLRVDCPAFHFCKLRLCKPGGLPLLESFYIRERCGNTGKRYRLLRHGCYPHLRRIGFASDHVFCCHGVMYVCVSPPEDGREDKEMDYTWPLQLMRETPAIEMNASFTQTFKIQLTRGPGFPCLTHLRIHGQELASSLLTLLSAHAGDTLRELDLSKVKDISPSARWYGIRDNKELAAEAGSFRSLRVLRIGTMTAKELAILLAAVGGPLEELWLAECAVQHGINLLLRQQVQHQQPQQQQMQPPPSSSTGDSGSGSSSASQPGDISGNEPLLPCLRRLRRLVVAAPARATPVSLVRCRNGQESEDEEEDKVGGKDESSRLAAAVACLPTLVELEVTLPQPGAMDRFLLAFLRQRDRRGRAVYLPRLRVLRLLKERLPPRLASASASASASALLLDSARPTLAACRRAAVCSLPVALLLVAWLRREEQEEQEEQEEGTRGQQQQQLRVPHLPLPPSRAASLRLLAAVVGEEVGDGVRQEAY